MDYYLNLSVIYSYVFCEHFNPLSANVGHARHDADVTGKIIKKGEKICYKMVYYTLHLTQYRIDHFRRFINKSSYLISSKHNFIFSKVSRRFETLCKVLCGPINVQLCKEGCRRFCKTN